MFFLGFIVVGRSGFSLVVVRCLGVEFSIVYLLCINSGYLGDMRSKEGMGGRRFYFRMCWGTYACYSCIDE